jgi:hypothetical protein
MRGVKRRIGGRIAGRPGILREKTGKRQLSLGNPTMIKESGVTSPSHPPGDEGLGARGQRIFDQAHEHD